MENGLNLSVLNSTSSTFIKNSDQTKQKAHECILDNINKIFSEIRNKKEFDELKGYFENNIENIFYYYNLKINHSKLTKDIEPFEAMIGDFESKFSILKDNIILISTHVGIKKYSGSLTGTAKRTLIDIQAYINSARFSLFSDPDPEPLPSPKSKVTGNESNKLTPLYEVFVGANENLGKTYEINGRLNALLSLSRDFDYQAEKIADEKKAEDAFLSGCCVIS